MKILSKRLNATAIVKDFAISSPVETVQPFGKGLINETFAVNAGGASFVLQRVNDSVFPEPELIMANLATLNAHLAQHSRAGLRIPALIAARNGHPFVRGEDGGVWRLMELIPNSRNLEQIENQEQAREVGRILGSFHRHTSDLPPDRLAVTLPGFHITPDYLERFTQVLDSLNADEGGKLRQAISFARERQGTAAVLEEAKQKGRIPLRVIHGDPKLDNILFDRTTDRAVSLIDLDTVQPGLVHYDLGDCLRSCCNRRGEAAVGNESVRFDLDLCDSILGAYAEEAKGVLSRTEIGSLYDAIRLIPFELGLRFLTDHLEGDRYFRVTKPGQNLHKARVQFALVEDIERKERDIRAAVARCFELGAMFS